MRGRDKAGDLYDCSTIEGTGEYKNLKVEAIVTRICAPFGINVSTNVDTGEVIPTFNIEQGMSAFEAIQKVCSMRACLAISDGRGGIQITRSGTSRAGGQLIEGNNILAATASYDVSERFSEYICKGQKQGDDNLSTDAYTMNVANIEDANMKRYRPLVIVADGEATKKDCETRAKWEANVRRGRSDNSTLKLLAGNKPVAVFGQLIRSLSCKVYGLQLMPSFL